MPALSRAGLAEGQHASRELTGARLLDAIFKDMEKLETIHQVAL